MTLLMNLITSPKHTKMEKIVKSCGECPFIQFDKSSYYSWRDMKCGHPDDAISGFYISRKALLTIHPNCPEKGAFIITTKKIEDDKS